MIKGWKSRKLSTLVGLVVVAFLAMFPMVRVFNDYIHVMTLCAIIGLAILGVDLLIGYTGLLSLGQGAFMAIGAYSTAILTVKYGFSPIAALLVGQILTLIFSLIIGKAVLRLSGYHFAIATLGFSIIIEQLLVNLRDFTDGPSGLPGVPSFSVFGVPIENELALYYLCFGLLLIVYIMLRNLTNCRVGRAWRAIAGDELAAGILGVNVDKKKLLAFAISACLASLGGSLYTHYMHFIAPVMVGMWTSLNLLVMAALGGPGNLWGPLLGATVLNLLPEVLSFLNDYLIIIHGLVLLLTMVFFPGGLSSLCMLPYRLLQRRRMKKMPHGKRGDQNESSHVINQRC